MAQEPKIHADLLEVWRRLGPLTVYDYVCALKKFPYQYSDVEMKSESCECCRKKQKGYFEEKLRLKKFLILHRTIFFGRKIIDDRYSKI